jgi:hypothetical protein
MTRLRIPILISSLCAGLYAQAPEPPHLIDPNMTFNEYAEGTRLLVLPKAITQLSFTILWKRGDDRHDDNGSSFHPRDFRVPDFRYVVLNFAVGLGKGFEAGFTLPNSWAANPLESSRHLLPHFQPQRGGSDTLRWLHRDQYSRGH